MGVPLALKNKSRKILLLKLLANIENYDYLRDLGSKPRKGTRGIDYCYHGNVLDPIRAIWDSFLSMNSSHLAKCWIKSGVLSLKHDNDLCLLHSCPIPSNYSEPIDGIASNNEICLRKHFTLTETHTSYVNHCKDKDFSLEQFVCTICGNIDTVARENARKLVCEWLDEAYDKEQPRPKIADKGNEKIVFYVNEVAKELPIEMETKKAAFRAQHEVEMSKEKEAVEKESYANMSTNWQWLTGVVEEAVHMDLR